MNKLTLFSRYPPERFIHSCPFEQEDWGKKQEGTARRGSSSHRDSETLTHETNPFRLKVRRLPN